jgi:hypothetical protein
VRGNLVGSVTAVEKDNILIKNYLKAKSKLSEEL